MQHQHKMLLSQRGIRLLASVLITGGVMAGCSLSGMRVSADSAGSPQAKNTTSSQQHMIALQGQALPISAQVTIGNQIIELEVAETPEQQQIGLMYRSTLEANRGMLFPFQPARPVGFWMKNVKINLDMVFLRDGKVEAVEANVPPCQVDPCPVYGPAVKVDQVIELAGGRAAALGIQPGDRLEVQHH